MSQRAARFEEADRDVIRRARSGSLPAYDELMRRYERGVLGFLLRRGASREDAEDLVQETFLRAWKRLHLYDERWAFSTWIFTIAARLSATHHRRRRAEVAVGGIGERSAAGEGAPEGAVERAEAGANLWRLADRVLKEEQRSALWLRYADEMPIKDIARVLGRSAVATRVLLFRARATLAAHLDENGEGRSAPAERKVAEPRPVVAVRASSRAELAAPIKAGGA